MAEKIKNNGKEKSGKAVKVLKLIGFILLCLVFIALLIHSLLCIFAKSYYPTFGNKRLFAIVSDSMEGEIPTGSLIVCEVPKDESSIEVGTVITYEVKQGDAVTLITHRVIAVNVNEATGAITYTTQGDNAPSADAIRPSFGDVVGIYTGKKCAVLGYVVGFLQSTEGAVALIIITLIIIFTIIMIRYVNSVRVWRNSALSALNKIRSVLSVAQVEELKTIADVVGILNKDPESKKELKRKDKKLEWFLITGALPKRPYKDDLCPTDAMSSNIEEKIPYLCYRFPQEMAGAETTDKAKEEATYDNTDGANGYYAPPSSDGFGYGSAFDTPDDNGIYGYDEAYDGYDYPRNDDTYDYDSGEFVNDFTPSFDSYGDYGYNDYGYDLNEAYGYTDEDARFENELSEPADDDDKY